MTTLIKKITLLMTVALIAAMSACSDDDSNPQPNPTEYTSAEAYLEEIGFSGSVLIRQGDTDLVRKGFGMADLANGTSNDPSLIYRIGSVTKSFTSAAIVNLKKDGLIESFDQPLSDFDDEFPQGDQITIRHLMTHHSGIPDYVGPIEAYVEENNYFFDTEEIFDIVMESIVEDGLIFTPGEVFSYSNSNYLIMGILIEELTGKTYQEYLQEKVYAPLNLLHTAKGPDAITGTERVRGYSDGLEVGAYQMQIAYSAGEIESTIADLEKWGDAMLGNYYTAEEKEVVFAAPTGQDGLNAPGAGWFTLNIEDQVIYHHGGNIDGFTSFLALIPESDGLIILLSNEQDKDEQRNQILETIMKNEF
ncbi:MAG: serine hydrolase [Ekhidna sp.]|nr:serine hydrolase [Ekhidna sp.]